MTLPSSSRVDTLGAWFVLVVLVGVMISPPIAVAGQVGLAALLLVSAQARSRLAATWQEPVVRAGAVFLLVIAAGVLYSAAGWREGASTLWGWRKLLMLPLALAFTGDVARRRWLVAAFVAAAAIAALVSFYGFFAHVMLPTSAEDGVYGIVARNHSTQGALFSVAVFGAAWLVAFAPAGTPPWHRWALAAAGALVLANIFLASPGRSGYVVLLVCAGVFMLGWAIATGRGVGRGIAVATVLVVVLLAGLAAVPASRTRIAQAVGELVTYKEQKELTSMGIRVVFWRNTMPLVAERPVFGWGTGGFEVAYKKQVEGQTGVFGTVTKDPHNQYLSILGQHGLVGLAVFLAFLVAAVRQRAPVDCRVLGLAVLAAWCTTSLANSHFATFAEGTFLYTWLGLALGSRPRP